MSQLLTPRQIQVIRLISEGEPCKAIGNFQTVKNLLKEIRARLEARSTAHAVAIAVRRGII